jgi:hypothetical protein
MTRYVTTTRLAIDRVTLNPSTIVRALATAAALFVLASAASQLTKYLVGPVRGQAVLNLFDADRESNLPTYFSAGLLLFAAALLGVIAVLKRRAGAPFGWGWTALSLVFLYMSVDEGTIIHESVLERLTRKVLGDPTIGVFYFAWVIPGIAFALVFAVVFWRFFLQLPRATRSRVSLAAGLFLGGALGVELIEGYHASLHGQDNLTFGLIATVEESLEMAGAITFIYALLKFIEFEYGEVRFRFGEPVQRSGSADED